MVVVVCSVNVTRLELFVGYYMNSVSCSEWSEPAESVQWWAGITWWRSSSTLLLRPASRSSADPSVRERRWKPAALKQAWANQEVKCCRVVAGDVWCWWIRRYRTRHGRCIKVTWLWIVTMVLCDQTLDTSVSELSLASCQVFGKQAADPATWGWRPQRCDWLKICCSCWYCPLVDTTSSYLRPVARPLLLTFMQTCSESRHVLALFSADFISFVSWTRSCSQTFLYFCMCPVWTRSCRRCRSPVESSAVQNNRPATVTVVGLRLSFLQISRQILITKHNWSVSFSLVLKYSIRKLKTGSTISELCSCCMFELFS